MWSPTSGERVLFFSAAGVVDPTWTAGLVRTSFGGSSGDSAQALATGQQTDGRSIAIGYHSGSGLGSDIALVRYALDGGPGGVDFGSGGKALVDLGGAEVVNDGLVRANSSIIAVGTLDGHFMVAQMSPGGSSTPRSPRRPASSASSSARPRRPTR